MTKRQKRIKYLIDYHPDVLQHFIEEGAYPIQGNRFDCWGEEWLMKDRNGLLARSKNPIPDDLLAAWYKFRFNEVQGDYNKLADAVEKLHKAI